MDMVSKPRQLKPASKASAMLFAFLKILLIIVAAFVALSCVCQTKLVFPGGRDVWRTPDAAPFGWPYEELNLSSSKYTTNAWFIQAPEAHGVVIFSHGNAGTIAGRLESVQVFRDLGFSVLIYDYGGYGKSTGKPSEKRCYADIRAMWRYLTEDQGVAPERIILFGRSLGGGVTAQLATEVAPAAVILESTFLSIPMMAKEIFPLLPVGPLIRHRFDTAKKIGAIHCPVLIVHSPGDTIIPFRHGRRLFELANAPKQFLEIRGDHNDGFIISQDIYAQGLAGFLGPLFSQVTG